MAFKGLLLAALLSVARCNPLGQTTLCESGPSLLPQFGPGIAPNILPYGYPFAGLGPMPLPYGGVNTMCETAPNLLGLGLGGMYGLNGLNGMYGLGPFNGLGPLNGFAPSNGATTVCEQVPNNMGFPGMAGVGTVCESVPNVGVLNAPLGLNYAGLGLPWAGGLGMGGVGSTTVCDTVPNCGLGVNYAGLGLPWPAYGGLGCGGIGLGGLGLGCGGMNMGATTVCEQAPNVLGMGLGLGRPFL